MSLTSVPEHGDTLIDREGRATVRFQNYLDELNELVSTLTDIIDPSTTDLVWDGSTLTVGGDVVLSGIPTSDPAVAGQLWNNSGVLTVSAG